MYSVALPGAPPEPERHELDAVVALVEPPEPFALGGVGIEPDLHAVRAEAAPDIGESPPAAHVDDDQWVLKELGENQRSLGGIDFHGGRP